MTQLHCTDCDLKFEAESAPTDAEGAIFFWDIEDDGIDLVREISPICCPSCEVFVNLEFA